MGVGKGYPSGPPAEAPSHFGTHVFDRTQGPVGSGQTCRTYQDPERPPHRRHQLTGVPSAPTYDSMLLGGGGLHKVDGWESE